MSQALTAHCYLLETPSPTHQIESRETLSRTVFLEAQENPA
jgi:hypothetical protein